MNRSPLLDLIRVIACEMVVVGHTLWFTDAVFQGTKVVQRPPGIFIASIGVLLFFIVSGAVISQSVMRNPERGFWSYFIDRFARIYSGLVPCLIVIFVIDSIHVAVNQTHFITYFGQSFSLLVFAGNLLMIQDLPLIGRYVPSFGDAFPLWTLNIEWWLYMSFGWVAFNYKRMGNWKYIIMAAILCFIPLFFLLSNVYENLIAVWYIGVAITLLMLKVPQFIVKHSLALFGVAGVAAIIRLVLVLNSGKGVYDFASQVFIGSVIFFLAAYSRDRFKPNVVIEWMAKYSYTLYLMHFPVMSLVFLLNTGINDRVLAVLAVLIANVVSFVLAYFTEMRYKDIAKWLKGSVSASKSVTG